MGKFNNRAGFGALRGSKNPLQTTSYISPKNPMIHDRWTDKSNSVTSHWDGSEWIVMTVLNEKTNTGLLVWVGTAAEYAAIVTKDNNTLYFLTA